MSLRVLAWLLFLMLLGTTKASFGIAQETFYSIVKKSVEERKKVTSFDCEFKTRKAGRQQSNVRNSPVSDYVIEIDGRIIYDEISATLLVKTVEKLVDWKSTDSEEEKAGREAWKEPKRNARIRLKDKEYFFNGNEPNALVTKNAEKDFDENQLPFDFRRFGIALQGDLLAKLSLDELQSNLCSNYRDLEADLDDDGLAWFDFGTFQIRFDSERGYWPTERILWGVKSRKQRQSDERDSKQPNESPKLSNERQFYKDDFCRVTPVLFEGFWVPKTVEMSRPIESKKIDFQWKSINQLVSPDDVDVDDFIKDLRRPIKSKTE